tara:strand:+ start:309 stop:908 length:600 start_codon:yes stop_codon:yes gene_type:complete
MKFILFVFILGSIPFCYAQEEMLLESKQYQEELNLSFRNAESSPLKLEDLRNFKALDFFPVDSAYIIKAQFKRTPNEIPFYMPTTTERLPEYVKYGEAHFSIGGKKVKLNIYQNKELMLQPEYEDYLFLPFTDLTNGISTYGGGRYLELRIPKGDEIIIDFNRAYNPYCAYNEKYSCPIPPAENDIYLEILAGVKDYKK